MQPANTRVHVEHGAADTNEFWDVSLTPLQLSYAGVETQDMRGFSISLDLATGAIALNAGYAPGSQEHRDETSMFSEFEDAATQALYEHASGRNGDYGIFVETAREGEFVRQESLLALSIELDEHEADLDED